MLIKDFIQSITILSLLQLVFSERSANNVYSYLCPHSPATRMIDVGAAAFTLFRIPVSNKMCKNNKAAAMGLSMERRPWGYLNNNNNVNNANNVHTSPMIGNRMNMNTERNLFSFNLNEMMRGKVDEESETKLEGDDKKVEGESKNVKVGIRPWKQMTTKYKKSVEEKDGNEESQPRLKNVGSSFSLSSLINVEALLLASGQVELESQDEATRANLLKDILKRESTTISTSNDNQDNNNDNSNNDNYFMKEIRSNASIEKSAVKMKNAEEQLSWETIQRNIKDLVESPTTFTPSFELSMAAEVALKEATNNIEEFLNDATSSFSPEKVQTLLALTSRSLAVDQNADVFKETMDKIVAAAETLAREQGVDVSEAAMQARATTKQTAEFVHFANGLLVAGYVRRDGMRSQLMTENDKDLLENWNIPTSDDASTKPLFDNYESAEAIPKEETRCVIQKGAEMALLAGAIYQDALEQSHSIGHSIVANGTSADVAWMVTDSLAYEEDFKKDEVVTKETPTLVRTITIRGYDASDESVDREKLLFNICDAAPVPLGDGSSNIKLHKGLSQVSREVYKDILPYIDMAGPNHKIILNGHSIGGSVANLLLFELTEERGAEFVNEKVQRVFTFGSPPIANLVDHNLLSNDSDDCSILKALKLRSDLVYGYIQPWDPIVRMFSRIDPLYPLIGDLGEDGYSLYASGPPRTLRPILRALLESWEEWPTFRENYRYVLNNEYLSTGIQHIFMPDIGRYLTDRLISVNIATFPIEDMIRISSKDLCSALEETFPLDTFSISLVPTAIRSFIHHFFPAYADFAMYAEKNKNYSKDNHI